MPPMLGVIARMDKQFDNVLLLTLLMAVILCTGIALLAKLHIARSISRAGTILRNWATQNHFELMHFEKCAWPGPFNPFTAYHCIIFFVRVRDQEHHIERSGWVRCGSLGVPIYFTNEAKVKWKESQ
jgi:hypothetical protein